jgi:hypothetical protein
MEQEFIIGPTVEHSRKEIIYDVINSITQEMIYKTEKKFKAWDKILENNILEEGTEEEIKYAYYLLQDPTIYAYAFFKDPRNPNKRFKLYTYQDAIINDPHKRIFFAAANQIGKSITLCLKAITFALLNPGKTVLMTSKTLPQSKDLLRQIKSFLQNSRLDFSYDIGDTETKTEIYFRHFKVEEVYDEKLDKTFTQRVELPQSRIICVPATEAALGYAVDLALVDELHFYDNGEYFYKQILQPRTYTTKGQIIIFTNPNGQQGIGWELWNDKNFHRYAFNFLDCPTNTQEEFDKLCEGLTREQIDSTLLAVFTSPEGGFLTLQERKDMQENRSSIIPSVLTQPIYVFFDWGKSMDRTVRVIGIPIYDNDKEWAAKVYVYEMLEYPQGTSYTNIIDEDLKNLIINVGMNKVVMVGWDNTGVGRGLEDFTKRVEQLGIMAMPVEFSLENKSRIYTLFKLLAEQKRLKIPYLKECDKQLSMLRFKRSSRGHLQVHHENERDRDDFPDAIAGLCSLIIQPENVPISAVIV